MIINIVFEWWEIAILIFVLGHLIGMFKKPAMQGLYIMLVTWLCTISFIIGHYL